MVRRDASRVRCFTKGGHDWTDRFPAIVDAALHLKASSFLIDGEAVIAHEMGRRTSMRCATDDGAAKGCCTPSTCWSTTATTCASGR